MKTSVHAYLFRATFALAILARSISATAQPATRIYWSQDNIAGHPISSSTPTGADRQDYPGVNYSPASPWDIDLDPFDRKLYWSEPLSGSIYRANLDGTNTEQIIQQITHEDILGLAVDPYHDKLYWTDHDLANIMRSNLDGTGTENLYHVPGPLQDVRDIAVDPFGEKIYWINKSTLSWSNLDGTNPQVLVPLSIDFEALSLDLVHQKIYWSSELFNPRIARANLDGSNVENILFGSSVVRPDGLVVDGIAGKMYWTDITDSRIRRANLDGTQIETILPGISFGRRITIDGSPVPEPTSIALLLGGALVATGTGSRGRGDPLVRNRKRKLR
jgi:hypothetical protein